MLDDAPPPRRQQILEALAAQLETHPGARITTARLAQAVGVSEAALYRHFPSKAKMFEALIVFAEDSVFGRINRILVDKAPCARRCEQILRVLLVFAERNPGVTRVLIGDALAGEHQRLRDRVVQFFDRIETQLRQTIREEEQRSPSTLFQSVPEVANLLLAVAEGRMAQYARSGFSRSPSEGWQKQWRLLEDALFAHACDLPEPQDDDP